MGKENVRRQSLSSDRQQPNDGKGSPPWRGEGDGAPVAPVKPRPEEPKTITP